MINSFICLQCGYAYQSYIDECPCPACEMRKKCLKPSMKTSNLKNQLSDQLHHLQSFIDVQIVGMKKRVGEKYLSAAITEC